MANTKLQDENSLNPVTDAAQIYIEQEAVPAGGNWVPFRTTLAIIKTWILSFLPLNPYGTSLGFLISQSGLNPPSAVTLFDEFGKTYSFSWVNNGVYLLTCTDGTPFQAHLTTVKFGAANSGVAGAHIFTAEVVDESNIKFKSGDKSDALLDDLFFETEMIITVYNS